MWDNPNWEVTESKELKPSLVGDISVPRGDDKQSLCWNFGWQPSPSTPPSERCVSNAQVVLALCINED